MYHKSLVLIILAIAGASAQACNNPDIVEQVVYPPDCRFYILCIFGTSQVNACPPGDGYLMIFVRGYCEEGNPETCEPGRVTTTTVAPPVNPPPTVCPPTGLHQIRHQDNCYQFFICIAGIPNERSCSPGLFFSSAFARCVRRAQSDCIDPDVCPEVDDPYNVIFIPDPEDCQVYFICKSDMV